MYEIFELPKDFLSRDYTEDEKSRFNKAIDDAIMSDKSPLLEELTPGQKKKVSEWNVSPFVHAIHDKAFGEGVDRIILPYDDSDAPKITSTNFNDMNVGNHARAVIMMLKHKNYETDDYHSGLAYHVDKPDRKMKIGSVLKKEKIDDREVPMLEGGQIVKRSLANVYEMDPDRKGAKQKKSIVITRNKYDVAGMSTGRRWTSCMNMVSGCNRHYLPKDIENGTLSAYFVTHDDNDIKNPIGRVNIKQFNGTGGDDIYRMEGRTYGNFPQKAIEAVDSWTKQKYEAKPGIYTKSSELYDDDGNSVIFERPDEIEDSQLLKHAKMAATNAIHAGKQQLRDYRDKHGHDDWHGEHDITNATLSRAYQAFNKIHNLATSKNFANSVIHGVADHSHEFDGTGQELDGETKYQLASRGGSYELSRVGDDDVHHYWAILNTDISNTRLADGISQMSMEEAHNHLQKIQHVIKHDEDAPHTALKRVHSMLIDHVIKNGAARHKQDSHYAVDSLLNHLSKPENEDYYFDLIENNRNSKLDTYPDHPIKFTSNPRIMHSLLEMNLKRRDWELTHPDTVDHIARHADTKLAHEFYTGGHVDIHSKTHDDGESLGHMFMRYTNDNRHGEHIQHMLLNKHGMMLSPESDLDEHTLFTSLAANTKFKSVFDRLKDRSNDDLNHPDIHDALKENQWMKRSVTEAYESVREFAKIGTSLQKRNTIENAYLSIKSRKI